MISNSEESDRGRERGNVNVQTQSEKGGKIKGGVKERKEGREKD